jgi:hypothetical protein
MTSSPQVGIIIPVFNDWPSCAVLLGELDTHLGLARIQASVVVVDDGSTVPMSPSMDAVQSLQWIRSVEVVRLVYNMGHQKAIAIGLAHAAQNHSFDTTVVMDADGEDSPGDAIRLIERQAETPSKIVFAKRERRSEEGTFRLFYALYKLLFRLLTGDEISFGNFCSIPQLHLAQVARLPMIWTHFASGVMRSGLPIDLLPTARAKRYAGKSSMNLVSLVMHGLSAISVYVDVMTVRLILGASVVVVVGVLGFLGLLYIRFFTPLAIPGWATTVAIGLGMMVFQALSLLAFLSLVFLNYRVMPLPIPARSYQDFILRVDTVRSHA